MLLPGFWWYQDNLLSWKGKFMATVYSLILPWSQKCLETHNAVLWILRSFSISSFNPINYNSLVWPWVYMNPSFQKFHHQKLKNKAFLARWRSGSVTRPTYAIIYTATALQVYTPTSILYHRPAPPSTERWPFTRRWGHARPQYRLCLTKTTVTSDIFSQHKRTLLVKKNQHLEDVLDKYFSEGGSCSVIDSTSLSR